MPLPDDLTTVTVTGFWGNASTGLAYRGFIAFTPSVTLTDSTGKVILPAVAIQADLINGAISLPLVATDNADIAQTGWTWNVVVNIQGAQADPWSFLLPSDPSTVDLTALTPVTPNPTASPYLSAALLGQPNGVAELNSSGQIPADEISALPYIPTSAEGAASGVATLDNSGHLTAGQAANLLAAANNLSDVESAATSRTNLGLGNAATLNVGTTSGTVAAGNDSRIVGALQTTGGTMSGPIAMGGSKVTGAGNGVADTDLATVGQLPTSLPPSGAAGGSLTGAYPNPGVGEISGVAVSGTPSAGQVLTATAPAAADWQTPTPAPVTEVFGRTGSVTAEADDYSFAQISGTAQVDQGGTGQTTVQAAMDALAGAVTSGLLLRGDGTHVVMAPIEAGDVPTLNQSTTGNAATATVATTADDANAVGGITVTGTPSTGEVLTATSGTAADWQALPSAPVTEVFGRTGSVVATSGDYSFSEISGTATIAQGGTGATTRQAAINALTGTQSAGTYLRSDGTNATLAAIEAGDVPTLNQSTSGNAATATTASNASAVGGIGVSGTPASGQVLTATSVTAADWQTPTTAPVTEVFGRTGAVTAQSGDYSFSEISGTAQISQGGTGATTAQAAINALAGAVTAAEFLRGNGTNVVLGAIQASDVPTLNQSTTGNAATASNATAVGGITVSGTPTSGQVLTATSGTAADWQALPSAPVTTVFGRTGAVVATSGDYSFSEISGTATIAQGGTGQTTAEAGFDALSPLTTLGDVLYEGSSGAARLAGSTSATKQYFTQTGTGSVSGAPAWGPIAVGDVPTLNQSTTGSAASFTGSLAGDVTGTQSATTVGKIQGVAVTAAEANLVADLNNATVRSVTATLLAGEETVFTGSTAAQTLTLPASPPSSSPNTVANAASVSVTLAPGAGATLSNFGTTGNLTIPAGYSFTLIYIGTTWYVLGAAPSDFAKSSLLSVANGGTGQSSLQAAINSLAGAVTAAEYLRGNGTNVVMSAIQAGDVPTLNQNTTGTAAGLSSTLAVGSGGTGQTTLQAAINALAGATTAAEFLRGNGTNVVMSAIQASDVPTLNQSTTGNAATATTATSFSGSLSGDVTGTQSATTVGKIQGVAVTVAEANLVSDLNNATARTVTATLLPGEETVFTGSTAAQTLTLPASPPTSSINTVTNAASVSVTLAPGAGATLSNFGTTGNIVIPAGYVFAVVYIGTTWYVQSAGPSDFAKNSALSILNGGTGQAAAPTQGETLVASSTSATIWTSRDFNVRAFGATGNGTTDDTTAINGALTAAASGGTVYFPPGTYLISTALAPSSGTRLTGAGALCTTIVSTSSSIFTLQPGTHLDRIEIDHLSLTVTGSDLFSGANIARSTVHDCILTQNSAGNSIWNAVSASLMEECVFERNEEYVYGSTRTVQAWVLSGGAINQCVWRDLVCWNENSDATQYYFYLYASTSGTANIGNTWQNIVFEQCYGGMIKLLSTTRSLLENCLAWDVNASNIANSLIYLGDSSGNTAQPARDTTIINCGRTSTSSTFAGGAYDIQSDSTSVQTTVINPCPSAQIDTGGSIGFAIVGNAVGMDVSGYTPSGTAGAGAGTSPPTPIVTAGSDTHSGIVTWGTGTSPSTGNQVSVSFGFTFATTPVVMVIPGNGPSSGLDMNVQSVTTTGFVISVGAAPSASEANTYYKAYYAVISG